MDLGLAFKLFLRGYQGKNALVLESNILHSTLGRCKRSQENMDSGQAFEFLLYGC